MYKSGWIFGKLISPLQMKALLVVLGNKPLCVVDYVQNGEVFEGHRIEPATSKSLRKSINLQRASFWEVKLEVKLGFGAELNPDLFWFLKQIISIFQKSSHQCPA